jgi:PAS domain S-box-containing protein
MSDLSREESFFSLAFSECPLAMAILRGDRIVSANSAFASLAGYSGHEQCSGESAPFLLPEIVPFLTPEETETRGQNIDSDTLLFPGHLHRQDGEPLAVGFSVTALPPRHSDGAGMTLLLLRNNTACSGRASFSDPSMATLFRSIVDEADTFILRWLADGTILFANASYCTYRGLSPKDIVGRSVFEFVPPHERENLRWITTSLSPERPTFTREIWAYHQGKKRWQEWTQKGIFDSSGHCVEIQEIGRDITDRVRAKHELEQLSRDLEGKITERTVELADLNRALLAEIGEREEIQQRLEREQRTLAFILDNTPNGVAFFDGRTISYVNREFTALTGYSLQHLGSIRECCHRFRPADEENSLCEQFWEGYLGDPAPYPVVLSIHCRNGEIRDIEFRASLASADALRVIMLEDVTERKRNERHIAKALKYQQELTDTLASVLENAPYGIVVTDGREIILVNPEFTLMTGYTRQDLPNRNAWFAALHSVTEEEAVPSIDYWEVINAEPESVIAPIRCKSGERKIAEFRRSRSLENGSFVIIVSDITERQRFAEELEKALQREKELNELKNTFISMVSHEFRTPMSTILSAATILDRHGESLKKPQIERYVESIRQGIFQMEHLLGNIIEAGRVESANLTCLPRHVELRPLLAAVVADVEAVLKQKGRIETTCEEDPEHPFVVDVDLLRPILTNLLSNAVKYSPETTTVFCGIRRQGEALRLDVRDSGIGIPQEDLGRLFHVFNRGRNVGTVRGTGLGLAIVKRCVSAHGGTISIDSVVNEGTVVTVLLPAGGGSSKGEEGTP